MSQQYSTKLEDLPVKNKKKVSSKLLEKLEKISDSDGDDDDDDLIVNQKVVDSTDDDDDGEVDIPESSNVDNTFYNLKNHIESYLQDSLIVFVLVFLLSNKAISSPILQKIPFINSQEPHSFVFNLLVSLLISILFIIIKCVIYLVT